MSDNNNLKNNNTGVKNDGGNNKQNLNAGVKHVEASSVSSTFVKGDNNNIMELQQQHLKRFIN